MHKQNFKDILVLAKYLAWNWFVILKLVVLHGPFDSYRDMRRFPWIRDLAKVNRILVKLSKGRTGNYLKALGKIINRTTRDMVDLLMGIFFHSDRLVLHEDMVPSEILNAMGLRSLMPEFLGIILPMIQPDNMEQYIDAAENEGVPPDVCSLPKATMGLGLMDQLPPAKAIVTSNLPCDGGMASYALLEKKIGAPVFRLDIPYKFYNEEAEAYFAGELRSMITWLEEHTPGRMDWDRLREICLERNRMVEYEMELWEIIRARPSPMSAEAIYLSHLWAFNVYPGYATSTNLFRDISRLAEENLDSGIAAVPGEKFRALLWNPPTLHTLDLFVWAEQAYGVSLIMDSMSYNTLPFIDTSTEESMLKGLGRNIMQGPMCRHTRGPMENYFNDMFSIVKIFDIDMIWVAGHIGCKNTRALNGILREKSRELGVPVLIIDYDLSDTRIVPREGIIAQVDYFMENVMNTKRRG